MYFDPVKFSNVGDSAHGDQRGQTKVTNLYGDVDGVSIFNSLIEQNEVRAAKGGEGSRPSAPSTPAAPTAPVEPYAPVAPSTPAALNTAGGSLFSDELKTKIASVYTLFVKEQQSIKETRQRIESAKVAHEKLRELVRACIAASTRDAAKEAAQQLDAANQTDATEISDGGGQEAAQRADVEAKVAALKPELVAIFTSPDADSRFVGVDDRTRVAATVLHDATIPLGFPGNIAIVTIYNAALGTIRTVIDCVDGLFAAKEKYESLLKSAGNDVLTETSAKLELVYTHFKRKYDAGAGGNPEAKDTAYTSDSDAKKFKGKLRRFFDLLDKQAEQRTEAEQKEVERRIVQLGPFRDMFEHFGAFERYAASIHPGLDAARESFDAMRAKLEDAANNKHGPEIPSDPWYRTWAASAHFEKLAKLKTRCDFWLRLNGHRGIITEYDVLVIRKMNRPTAIRDLAHVLGLLSPFTESTNTKALYGGIAESVATANTNEYLTVHYLHSHAGIELMRSLLKSGFDRQTAALFMEWMGGFIDAKIYEDTFYKWFSGNQAAFSGWIEVLVSLLEDLPSTTLLKVPAFTEFVAQLKRDVNRVKEILERYKKLHDVSNDFKHNNLIYAYNKGVFSMYVLYAMVRFISNMTVTDTYLKINAPFMSSQFHNHIKKHTVTDEQYEEIHKRLVEWEEQHRALAEKARKKAEAIERYTAASTNAKTTHAAISTSAQQLGAIKKFIVELETLFTEKLRDMPTDNIREALEMLRALSFARDPKYTAEYIKTLLGGSGILADCPPAAASCAKLLEEHSIPSVDAHPDDVPNAFAAEKGVAEAHRACAELVKQNREQHALLEAEHARVAKRQADVVREMQELSNKKIADLEKKHAAQTKEARQKENNSLLTNVVKHGLFDEFCKAAASPSDETVSVLMQKNSAITNLESGITHATGEEALKKIDVLADDAERAYNTFTELRGAETAAVQKATTEADARRQEILRVLETVSENSDQELLSTQKTLLETEYTAFTDKCATHAKTLGDTETAATTFIAEIRSTNEAAKKKYSDAVATHQEDEIAREKQEKDGDRRVLAQFVESTKTSLERVSDAHAKYKEINERAVAASSTSEQEKYGPDARVVFIELKEQVALLASTQRGFVDNYVIPSMKESFAHTKPSAASSVSQQLAAQQLVYEKYVRQTPNAMQTLTDDYANLVKQAADMFVGDDALDETTRRCDAHEQATREYEQRIGDEKKQKTDADAGAADKLGASIAEKLKQFAAAVGTYEQLGKRMLAAMETARGLLTSIKDGNVKIDDRILHYTNLKAAGAVDHSKINEARQACLGAAEVVAVAMRARGKIIEENPALMQTYAAAIGLDSLTFGAENEKCGKHMAAFDPIEHFSSASVLEQAKTSVHEAYDAHIFGECETKLAEIRPRFNELVERYATLSDIDRLTAAVHDFESSEKKEAGLALRIAEIETFDRDVVAVVQQLGAAETLVVEKNTGRCRLVEKKAWNDVGDANIQQKTSEFAKNQKTLGEYSDKLTSARSKLFETKAACALLNEKIRTRRATYNDGVYYKKTSEYFNAKALWLRMLYTANFGKSRIWFVRPDIAKNVKIGDGAELITKDPGRPTEFPTKCPSNYTEKPAIQLVKDGKLNANLRSEVFKKIPNPNDFVKFGDEQRPVINLYTNTNKAVGDFFVKHMRAGTPLTLSEHEFCGCVGHLFFSFHCGFDSFMFGPENTHEHDAFIKERPIHDRVLALAKLLQEVTQTYTNNQASALKKIREVTVGLGIALDDGLFPALCSARNTLFSSCLDLRSTEKIVVDTATMRPMVIGEWASFYEHHGGPEILCNMLVDSVGSGDAACDTEHGAGDEWFSKSIASIHAIHSAQKPLHTPKFDCSGDILSMSNGDLDAYFASFGRTKAGVMTAMHKVTRHNMLLELYLELLGVQDRAASACLHLLRG